MSVCFSTNLLLDIIVDMEIVLLSDSVGSL